MKNLIICISVLLLNFQAISQSKSDTLKLVKIDFFDGEIHVTFNNEKGEEISLEIEGKIGVPIINGYLGNKINLLDYTDYGSVKLFDSPNNPLIDLYTNQRFLVEFSEAEYSSVLISLTLLCQDCKEETATYNGIQITNYFIMLNLSSATLGLESVSKKSLVSIEDFEKLSEGSNVVIWYRIVNNEMLIYSLKID